MRIDSEARIAVAIVLLGLLLGVSPVQTPLDSNLPPVAEAGPDLSGSVGEPLVFDGSASYDPDGFTFGDLITTDDEVPGSNQLSVDLAASGSTVYAAWVDDRNRIGSETTTDIYFSRATGVLTFERGVKLNEENRTHLFYPTIAVEGGAVAVAWLDDPSDAIRVRVSSDGGATFGPEVAVGSSTALSRPRLWLHSGSLHLVWVSSTPQGSRVVYSVAESGLTFASPRVLREPGILSRQSSPDLTVTATGWVHVVWEEEQGGRWLLYHAIRQPGEDRFTVTGGPGTSIPGSHRLPAVAAGDDRVTVAWWLFDTSWTIYLAESHDGLTFDPPRRLSDPVVMATRPAVGVDAGGLTHAAWEELRDGRWLIAYVRGRGADFTEPRLAAPDSPTQQLSAVATTQEFPLVAWEDRRTGYFRIKVVPVPRDTSRLSYIWDFGDGVGATAAVATHAYALPGLYVARLTAADEFGAEDDDEANVTVSSSNRQPVVSLQSAEGQEGLPVLLNASASFDPDGNPLMFRWDFDGDGTWDTDWSSDPKATHTFGDDWVGTVRVEVSDGALSATAEAPVAVHNATPTIEGLTAVVTVNDPRTVGYWGHQCTVDEADPYGEHAGIPQPWIDLVAAGSRAFAGVTSKAEVCAIVDEGDAEDMAVMLRRQLMGAWLNVASGKLDPRTAVVLADLTSAAAVGEAIREADDLLTVTADRAELERAKDLADAINNGRGIAVAVAAFTAEATDVGSDDLTFSWDFGDGGREARTYFNDGVGPDPFPSPDVNPMAATDETVHSYWGLGTYTVTLSVTDDDGGTVVRTFILTVG